MKVKVNLSNQTLEYMDSQPYIQGTDSRNKLSVYIEHSSVPQTEGAFNIMIAYALQNGRTTIKMANTGATQETIDDVLYDIFYFTAPKVLTSISGNFVATLILKVNSNTYKVNVLNTVLNAVDFEAFEDALDDTASEVLESLESMAEDITYLQSQVVGVLHNTDIVDNDDSNDPTKVLSARMGKVLAERIGATTSGLVSATYNESTGVLTLTYENDDTYEMKIGLSTTDKSNMADDVENTILADLFETFSTVKSYSTGDFVNYENNIYEFVSDKSSGAWDSTKVVIANLNDYMDEVNTSLANMTETIEGLGNLQPSGTDTSTNILAKTTADGIWIATDNGHWYYWDGTQYVDGGVYQATALNEKTEFNINKGYAFKDMLDIFNLVSDSDDSRLVGKYINSNGAILAQPIWQVFIIDVTNIDTLIYLPENNNITSFYAFYDSSDTYIASSWINTKIYTKIAIPSGAKYFKISNAIENYGKFKVLALNDIIFNLDYDYINNNNLMDLLGKANNELVDKWYDNYYVSYSSGNVIELTDWSTTELIRVYPNTKYEFSGGNGGSQLAVYDKSLNRIDGIVTNANAVYTMPSNAYFIRWCCYTANKSDVSIKVNNVTENETYVIDTTIGLLQGVINAANSGYSKIYVKAGTYDLIQEYENKYGNTYFSDYTTNYNGLVNGYYDRGLWLENVEIKFEIGAIVECYYLGNNDNVKTYFSAFATGNNVIIDGLVLKASHTRYGIHPDFNSGIDETYFIVKNCDLSFDKPESENDNLSLGCGLGVHCNWLFENNIFRSNSTTPHRVLRIHNNISNNALSKICVRNNYIDGKGYFEFNDYSTSTNITNILVYGNSYATAPVKDPLQTANNMLMITYNNELRS